MDGKRCSDRFPAVVPDKAMLYLTPPDRAVAGALDEVALRVGLMSEEPFEDVLAMSVTAAQLRELSTAWKSGVCKVDLKDTRCRLTSDGMAPSPSDLMRTQRLWDLIRWIDGQWVQNLVRTGKLVTHFQPIVCSSEPSRVFAHECLLRGVEGDDQLVSPIQLYAAARAVGQLKSLDEAARLRAVESASQSKLTGCVFINFNPRSIDDPTKDLTTTIERMLASDIPTDRFVLEVVESDKIVDIDNLLYLLDYCRENGCRVALDDVGDGYSSLNLLARIKPDFIKIDMSLIREVDRDPYVRCVTEKILELAKELQVETVVEGVETVGQWQWAAEQGAEYAQGYLFARPAPDPPVSAFSGSLTTPATVSAAKCETNKLNVAEGNIGAS